MATGGRNYQTAFVNVVANTPVIVPAVANKRYALTYAYIAITEIAAGEYLEVLFDSGADPVFMRVPCDVVGTHAVGPLETGMKGDFNKSISVGLTGGAVAAFVLVEYYTEVQ
jgi:hypothetical protein